MVTNTVISQNFVIYQVCWQLAKVIPVIIHMYANVTRQYNAMCNLSQPDPFCANHSSIGDYKHPM